MATFISVVLLVGLIWVMHSPKRRMKARKYASVSRAIWQNANRG